MSNVRRFGRYEIQRVLGRGGMGTVHLAQDPLIGRTVAIKEIRLDSSDDEEGRREIEERFRREFRAAGKLSHPNVVTIFDVGQGGGSYFIAMEYVEGMSLAERLKKEPKPPHPELCKLASQIASGLDYAHANNIVHRDIKPGNVLLTRDGRPKITDFGLVKMLTSELTMTGTVLGTPAFMSPEQVMGSNVDGKSDQFSFAVILYLMLTGDQPFAAEHPSAILYKIVHEPPPRPQELNIQLPTAVDEIILRALSKKPEDRYPDCSTLANELSAVLEPTASQGTVSVPQQDPTSDAPPPTAQKSTTRAVSDGDSSSHSPETYVLDGPTPTPRPARRPTSGLTRLFGAIAFLAAMAWAGYYASSREPVAPTEASTDSLGSTATGSVAATVEQPAEKILDHALQIEAGPAGAAIYLNDRDTGLTVPAAVTLRGAAGEAQRLELLLDGDTVAELELTLGNDPPPTWQPEVAATTLTLEITSLPSGAAISIDGRDTGTVTPARHEFEARRRYALALNLAGYEPVGWSFGLSELRADQRECACVHFPLASSAPPGLLTLRAPYPVTIKVGNRTHGPFRDGEVAVTPGRHTVELVAEEVFLRQTTIVDVESDQRLPLRVPKAVAVRITANPANCEVVIDGIDVDVTPINDRRVVVGSHEFSFHWPALGKTKTVRKTVSRPGQKIFEKPD